MHPSPTDVRPPFTEETARLKVRRAQDAFNSCNPQRAALHFAKDAVWDVRNEHVEGRAAIEQFLERKWQRQLGYRHVWHLLTFDSHRITVSFEYEWRDSDGNWYRSHGDEHWTFGDDGLMTKRVAVVLDVPIEPTELRYGDNVRL